MSRRSLFPVLLGVRAPAAFWIFLAALPVAAVVLACGGGVPRPTAPDPPPRMWARDEFRKLVVGKTKEEVINSLGNPDRISGDGLRWTYRGRTYDPTATSNDISTTVRFGRETGKVIRVDF